MSNWLQQLTEAIQTNDRAMAEAWATDPDPLVRTAAKAVLDLLDGVFHRDPRCSPIET